MATLSEKKGNHTNNRGKGKKQGLVSNSIIEKFRLVLLALLGIVVFYPPFLRGLYFEEEQLPTEIFVFIIYLAFLAYKYIKQDKKFIKTPMEYVSLGFVLVYLVSIFASVGTREAIGEWLKYCMFFVVFIMLSELLNTYKSKIAMLWVLVTSSLGISIIGIDGIAGGKLATFLNSAFKVLGADREIFYGIFVGNRVNSTFQYPNATAAYLLAIFFVAVTLMLISKKVYGRLFAGAASYIVLITFMLTLSRGAIVFLPVVGVLLILMQSNGRKIRAALNMIPGGVGMLAVVTKLSNIMASPEGNELRVWKYFILGIIVTAVIQMIIEYAGHILLKIKEKDINSYNKLKTAGYVFCGLAVVAVIACAVIAVTAKAPLVLSHEDGQADSNISIRRSFTLEPGKEYKLVYNVQAENKKDKPNSYNISVGSRDFSGIISEKDMAIINVDGKATNGLEQREVLFKVPENSKAVSITFGNYFEGTKAEFKDAKIISVDNSGKQLLVNFKFKYIPENIYSRIDDLKETRNGFERTIFAKNGFEIFKEHPILGGGGGSWPLQYFAHQSYLYWTTQAHNYPVQVAVETGIIGVLVLIGLWVAVGCQFIESIRKWKIDRGDLGVLNKGVMAGCLVLIMHSFVDFDLSLSSIYLVLWELLAIVNSNVLYEDSTENKPLFNRFIKEVKTVTVSPIITGIVFVVILVFPIMFINGLNNSIEATRMQNQNNLSGAIMYAQKALNSDSISPKYKAEYINLIIRQDPNKIKQSDIIKTNKYAESIEKAGENSVDIAIKLASYYLGIGNVEKGLHFLQRETELAPLRTDVWEQKAAWYYQMYQLSASSGDSKSKDKYQNLILQITEDSKKASQKSMIPFTLTSTTMEIIEKMKLLQVNQGLSGDSLLSKSVFYSWSDIDVDGNGVPDVWNDTNTNDLKIQVDGNKLTVEAQSGKQGVLQSRKIILKPGKTYSISVELENNNDVKEIAAILSGTTDQIKLVKNGSTYTTQFNTQAGGNIDPVSIGLVVNGKYVIKDARIAEK